MKAKFTVLVLEQDSEGNVAGIANLSKKELERIMDLVTYTIWNDGYAIQIKK